MAPIGLWTIEGSGPRKLLGSSIELEAHLEDWIERDPDLLEAGLTIVGRQMGLEAGPLDLLAIDPQSRWVVVEIKRGAVRRDTIAQALDYASCIASMPYERLAEKVNTYLAARSDAPGPRLESILAERGGEAEAQATPRNVVIFVVGTGRDPGLERMVGYLVGTYDLPISVVSYEVFGTGSGQKILMRELSQSEGRPPTISSRSSVTVDDVCALAESGQIGTPFRALLAAAQRHGLYPRPYKTSIMYTPPSNHSRCLFTAWAIPRTPGTMRLWVSIEKFAEFYSVSEEDVQRALGQADWRSSSPAEIDAFIAALDRFFASLGASDNDPADPLPISQAEGPSKG